jgi:hypothetical protein
MRESTRRNSKTKPRSTKRAPAKAARPVLEHIFWGTKVIDELRILLRLAAPSRVPTAQ